MSNKKKKGYETITQEVDIGFGVKLHLYELCGCCLQEVKSSWKVCQYCEAEIIRKGKGDEI